MIRLFLLVLGLLLAGAAQPALADDQPTAQETQLKTAVDAVFATAHRGPTVILLKDLAKVSLGEEYSFVEKAVAADFMRALGNSTDDQFIGMIIPSGDSFTWFATVDYIDSGHVSDDDAKSWDADSLLEQIRSATDEGNTERAKQGIPALDIIGWAEPPQYNGAGHRLVWSMLAKERGAPADQNATINYNTYALGREGYFSIDLITDDKAIAQDKEHAKKLISNLAFNPGQTYEDYNASTDRLAEYGLAALIGGVAAKKLGLLALAGVFFAKFAKLILIGVAVLGGTVAKIFRRRSSES